MNIRTSSNKEVRSKLRKVYRSACFVDMHEEATSDLPLFTSDVANCLVVIIHDNQNKIGHLMHIFPLFAGGSDPVALFYYVTHRIEEALKTFSHTGVSIFLWKGISLTQAGCPAITKNYGDFARQKFHGRAEVIDKMDKHKISLQTKILYNPDDASITIIEPEHDDLFNAEIKNTGVKKLANFSSKEFERSITTNSHVADTVFEIQEHLMISPNSFGEVTSVSASFFSSSPSPSQRKPASGKVASVTPKFL